MLKRIRSISLLYIGDSLRVSYCYDETDASGNVVTQNLRGSYENADQSVEAFMQDLSAGILAKLNGGA